MNTYAIDLWGHTETEVALTAGKAKYQFFRNHEIGDSMEFCDFLKSVKCKLLSKFHYKDLFQSDLSDFQDTLRRRNIEFAHLGMMVEVCGKTGRIVGCNNSLNLDVCFDGEWWKTNCHPWYKIKYFNNYGNVVAEYID